MVRAVVARPSQCLDDANYECARVHPTSARPLTEAIVWLAMAVLAVGFERMEEQKQPNGKPRSVFWTPKLEIIERRRAYERKVENLSLDIQHQRGLESEPRKISLTERPPNLTQTMVKLIEGFKLTLVLRTGRYRASTPPIRIPARAHRTGAGRPDTSNAGRPARCRKASA